MEANRVTITTNKMYYEPLKIVITLESENHNH